MDEYWMFFIINNVNVRDSLIQYNIFAVHDAEIYAVILWHTIVESVINITQLQIELTGPSTFIPTHDLQQLLDKI